MKYCPRCGKRLSDNSVFCSRCGYEVGSLKGKDPVNIHQTYQKVNTNKKFITVIVIILIILGIWFIGKKSFYNYEHPSNKIPPNLASRSFTGYDSNSGFAFRKHTFYYSDNNGNAAYVVNYVNYHRPHSNNNVIIHARRTSGSGSKYNTFYLHVSNNDIKRYKSTDDLS